MTKNRFSGKVKKEIEKNCRPKRASHLLSPLASSGHAWLDGLLTKLNAKKKIQT